MCAGLQCALKSETDILCFLLCERGFVCGGGVVIVIWCARRIAMISDVKFRTDEFLLCGLRWHCPMISL